MVSAALNPVVICAVTPFTLTAIIPVTAVGGTSTVMVVAVAVLTGILTEAFWVVKMTRFSLNVVLKFSPVSVRVCPALALLGDNAEKLAVFPCIGPSGSIGPTVGSLSLQLIRNKIESKSAWAMFFIDRFMMQNTVFFNWKGRTKLNNMRVAMLIE